ncbi:DgyrCDS14931 [Dimorphilus gyrociliatus]|uniref:DgyrCDS14931 n=1 Tax=Dimorphilus gyrociliatus TaxID=2664684 RepID=A0A7I8WFG4_9ANNE|nr:DgyrCDS14931 [Dimorphilus gyrociliatus]
MMKPQRRETMKRKSGEMIEKEVLHSLRMSLGPIGNGLERGRVMQEIFKKLDNAFDKTDEFPRTKGVFTVQEKVLDLQRTARFGPMDSLDVVLQGDIERGTTTLGMGESILEELSKGNVNFEEISLFQNFWQLKTTLHESSVRRWVREFKGGRTNILDDDRQGCPSTASNNENKERIALIRDNRRISQAEISQTLNIGHAAVEDLISSLGMRKIVSRWIPYQIDWYQKAYKLLNIFEQLDR